jgi:RNA polymerase sigma-70 factor, ECF subfamily
MDGATFGSVYLEWAPRIRAYLRARLGTPDAADLAEDLTQDVFVRAWRALPGFEARGVPIGAWLFTIAHNRLVDHGRRAGVERRRLADRPGPAASADDAVGRVADRLALASALAALGPGQRALVVLRYGDGLTETALARRVGGVSRSGVRKRLLRACREMRVALDGP